MLVYCALQKGEHGVDSIAVKPKRAQVMTNVIALGILCGLSLASVLVSGLCAMLLPLFACPLARHQKEEKLAWAACAFPAIGCLLRGGDPVLAAVLLVPGMLPLWATRQLHPKKLSGLNGIVLYTCLSAMSAALVLGFASYSAATPFPDVVTEKLAESETSGMLLFQLAQMGLVNLPEGFEQSSLLSPLMQPVMLEQMLLSFRRTVELYMVNEFPMLVTHACLLIGLFTALRVEHLNGVMLVVAIDPNHPGERKTHVTSPPGFRLLTLPPQLRVALAVLMFASVLLLSSGGLGHTLALMGAQFILTCYQLVGASVMVFVFARHNPDQLRLIGGAVGLVYALLPTVPLLIGIADSFIHFRTHKVREDSES